MGIKLIILLALLVGVLYSLHLLVQDYQALSAPRLFRFLFKRDVASQHSTNKRTVRWKRILEYDPIQCARYLYCDLGARPADSVVRRGFTFMLKLEPKLEDKPAWEVFKGAYHYGESLQPTQKHKCSNKYATCPFHASLLFDLINYLLRDKS